jgi:L-alanine-DL-glutamate epimerase-like enolase superfamily enzyme
VLRLRTDSGLEGVSFVSRIAPYQMAPMVSMIQGLAELLKDEDVAEPGRVYARLYRAAIGAPVSGLELRAASALEVASWDLKGKALGLPVYKLLGATRDRVPVSANWRLQPGQERDVVAAHVQDLLSRGFRAIKCPVGFAPLDVAIAHVKFVRECAGPQTRIIIDGNFQWTVKDALRFARETEELNLYWIEDPIASHDLAGMREITASVKQRTCAGEVFQHPYEYRALLEGRCSDNIMVDQDLGLTGVMRVVGMAHICGTPVINHLAPEVLSHAITAAPNGLIVGLVPWGQPLFQERAQIDDGELVMPSAPGLGLTFDEDALRAGRVT